MGRKLMSARRRESAAMIVFLVCLSLAGSANAQLRKINIAYTATSPYQAVLIVAKEVGLFKGEGRQAGRLHRLEFRQESR